MGDAADDAYRRAEQELEDGDDDHGRAHCGECGERFMGDELAEVVLKDPKTGEAVGPHLTIHQSCYDENLHEVA